MRSSYKENNYNGFFESIAKIYKPKLVVECGVLDGYSLLAMAKGAPQARIIGLDLFEEYEHKHGNADQIYSTAFDEGCGLNVELRQENALEAYRSFKDESIDLLHFDVSNDGRLLWDLFEVWQNKVKKDTGLLIFEGGSEERDCVGWMLKYQKMPINMFKHELRLRKSWEFVTLTPFPSLTVCRKIR